MILKQFVKIVQYAIIILIVFAIIYGSKDYFIEKSKRILTEQGYKDIYIKGQTYFGECSDEEVGIKFSATNSSGVHVNGVVCSGFIKASTIRFQ